MLNFDRNHLKLFETDEKVPKDSGQIFVKKVVLMDEKHEGGDCQKVENLHRRQSDLALENTPKQLF